jgi:hypothetical protein
MRVTVGWNESLFTLLDSLIPIRRRERKGVMSVNNGCRVRVGWNDERGVNVCEQWMQVG